MSRAIKLFAMFAIAVAVLHYLPIAVRFALAKTPAALNLFASLGTSVAIPFAP